MRAPLRNRLTRSPSASLAPSLPPSFPIGLSDDALRGGGAQLLVASLNEGDRDRCAPSRPCLSATPLSVPVVPNGAVLPQLFFLS